MQVQVTTKNLKIEDDIKEYAERKLSKLAKYLNSISSVKLELVEEKSKSRLHTYSAQATVNVNGFLIRGEQKGEDIHATIDAVSDVMERLIERYKSRYDVNKNRTAESIRKSSPGGVVEETEEVKTIVVKTKRFSIKPMTVEEAIDQMEQLGHDFFLFSEQDTNELKLIYRRKDGDYGIIHPQVKKSEKLD